MPSALLNKFRNGAKKMVAKGKTYGKKKGRDLTSTFIDLSISPNKPGASAISRALGPSPDSHDEALLGATVTTEEGQAAEAADQNEDAESEEEQESDAVDDDEDKENRPRPKVWLGEQPEERIVKHQAPTEISQLTSLDFVGNRVEDFQKFCKGWEQEFKLTKIGQGSYATVLKMESHSAPGQYSVWKLMPLKPSQGPGSRPHHNQTLIKDAATEVKMLNAMSDTDGFVQFRSAYVVKGIVPDQIGKAHESWAKKINPEDTWYETQLATEFPSKDQLWLLMEMTDAGQDLDWTFCVIRSEPKWIFSVHETSDIFWGIAEALMRGEAQADFEHRDLHPGNICIKQRDEPVEVTTADGIPRVSKREVTLIDYTQSRLTLGSGDVLATAIDESIFRQSDKDPVAQRQYDAYRAMREIVKKEKRQGVSISQMWQEYVPMTNVLWLLYMLRELMPLTRKKSVPQEEAVMINALLGLEMKLRTWEYHSAGEVVAGFLIDP